MRVKVEVGFGVGDDVSNRKHSSKYVTHVFQAHDNRQTSEVRASVIVVSHGDLLKCFYEIRIENIHFLMKSVCAQMVADGELRQILGPSHCLCGEKRRALAIGDIRPRREPACQRLLRSGNIRSQSEDPNLKRDLAN